MRLNFVPNAAEVYSRSRATRNSLMMLVNLEHHWSPRIVGLAQRRQGLVRARPSPKEVVRRATEASTNLFGALHAPDSSDAWKRLFMAALRSVMGRDTLMLLGIVFDRLYVLRNQLFHGGAARNSRVNRQQIGDGASLQCRSPFNCCSTAGD